MANEIEYLYRFIPFNRLLEMISSGTMPFLKFSKWDDPFEGYLFKRVNEENKWKLDDEAQKLYFSCWTYALENDFFWRLYTPNKDGVRIKVSIKNLQKAGLEPIKIKYLKKGTISAMLDFSNDLDVDRVKSWFEIKRKPFDHEKEYRIIVIDDPAKKIVYKKFNFLTNIESVALDPRMPENMAQLYKKELRSIGYTNKCYQSTLYNPDNAFR